MNRKIHVEIAKDQVEGETCYICGKPAVIAVRGDMNERGTGFCLCKDCFTYTLGNLLDKALALSGKSELSFRSQTERKESWKADSGPGSWSGPYYGRSDDSWSETAFRLPPLSSVLLTASLPDSKEGEKRQILRPAGVIRILTACWRI